MALGLRPSFASDRLPGFRSMVGVRRADGSRRSWMAWARALISALISELSSEILCSMFMLMEPGLQ